MNTGSVQRIFPVCDPHETGTLFKGLRSQLRYFQELFSGDKSAVFFPVGHDIFGQCFGDTGNMLQKRRGSRIQINPHPVYRGLHHTCQRLPKLFLIHIMLILPYADSFRFDLYKLS